MKKIDLVNILIENGVTAKREVKDLEQYLLNKYTKKELEGLVEYLSIGRGVSETYILLSEVKDLHDTNIATSDLLEMYESDNALDGKNWTYKEIYEDEFMILIDAYETDGFIIIDDLSLNIEKVTDKKEEQLTYKEVLETVINNEDIKVEDITEVYAVSKIFLINAKWNDIIMDTRLLKLSNLAKQLIEMLESNNNIEVIVYKKDGLYNRMEVFLNNKKVITEAKDNTKISQRVKVRIDRRISKQLDLFEKMGATFELVEYEK